MQGQTTCLKIIILTLIADETESPASTRADSQSSCGRRRIQKPARCFAVRHTPTHIHPSMRSAGRTDKGREAGKAGHRA